MLIVVSLLTAAVAFALGGSGCGMTSWLDARLKIQDGYSMVRTFINRRVQK